MKSKKEETPKQPGFIFTVSFNGVDGSTSFMSKDMTKDSVSFIMGLNVANFLKQSTLNKDEYVTALDKFLVGIENITEEYIGPAFVEDKKAETKEIVEQLKKIATKKDGHKCKCGKKCTSKKKKKL